jgi:hypothetical protein
MKGKDSKAVKKTPAYRENTVGNQRGITHI